MAATIQSYADLRPRKEAVAFIVKGVLGIETHQVSLTMEEANAFVQAWSQDNRPHIQNMPEAAKLKAGDREFFISGIPPEAFDKMFSDEEE
jgi:hypothetical protein